MEHNLTVKIGQADMSVKEYRGKQANSFRYNAAGRERLLELLGA